jgi:hypothetical protein
MVQSSEGTQSNPEIGMQGDSFEAVEATADSGSLEFFNEIEKEVNSSVIDSTEATQSPNSGTEQVTHNTQDNGSGTVESQSNNSTDWEKRYKDSSRQAVKWRDKYQEVEQFVPVLDAMKNDSGLVDHVRGYLENGGAPAQSIQEELKLGDDFIYDQQEAVTDPESDSAKVMNAHVDKLVQGRVGQMLGAEKERAKQMVAVQKRSQEEQAFKERNNMSDDDFTNFKTKAQEHVMSLDDINYLLNRGEVAKNVAKNTKNEMISQMKNVRAIPTSASGANSQGQSLSQDDMVFNAIKGLDDGVDNLFG